MSLTWRHRSGIFQKTCTLRSYNGGNVWLWICNTRHLRTLSDDDIEVVRLEGPQTRHNTRASHEVNVAGSALQTARVFLDGLYIHRSETMNIYTCIMCFSAINATLLSAGNPPRVVTLLNRYQSIDDIASIRWFIGWKFCWYCCSIIWQTSVF